MRTFNAGSSAVLASPNRVTFARARVVNASGTVVDLSNYGGTNWLVGADWGANIDEVVPSAQLSFARMRNSTQSLAPLMSASTLNVNDAAAYSVLLDAGAEIFLDTATLAQGSTLPASGSTEWLTQFYGEIDAVDWDKPEIMVYARDKIGALLADRWIESEKPYGIEAGTAIETVMQDIHNDWADGQAVQVPSSPGFLVTTYQQTQQSVLEADRTLAQLIGYDARPQWYNTTSSFAFVFSEPNRTASTAQWTFGPGDYLNVTRLNISRENVRNVVTVKYTLSSTAGSTTAGQRQTYTASDSTSISRFGRRWMELDLPDDSDIDTLAEATDLGDACLSDLMIPDAEQEIETPYFWPVMLGDYYSFSANAVHYDTTQSWAVRGYRHSLKRDSQRSFLTVRGKPAGQYANWFRRNRIVRSDNDQTIAKSLNDFKDSQNSTADTVTFTWRRGDLVSEVWVYDNLYTQPEPASPWPSDSDAPTSILTVGTDSYVASIPAAQKMRTIQFEPRTAVLEAGPVKRVRLFPRTLTSVGSTDISDSAIISSKLIASAQTFGSDIVFSATDNDTVAWTAGTITFASSTAYTIGASNTGNMASTALRYIYLDTAIATTALVTTTTLTDTVGDGRTLLAVVAKAPSTQQSAFYVPAVGVLGLNQDNFSARSISGSILQTNILTASHISTIDLDVVGVNVYGTLQAAVIIASSQFTAALAQFKGVTIGSSTGYGTGQLTVHDLVRFRTAGAIQVEDGRLMEFSNASVDAGFARLNYTSSGSLKLTGVLQTSTRTSASASTNFAASKYFTMEDESGNVMFVPCTTAAW